MYLYIYIGALHTLIIVVSRDVGHIVMGLESSFAFLFISACQLT